ncbi:MAG TPA: EamA family transporter [Bryobacteraceae bacterium]|jgi:inner membrane transporter RhtA|nr:EamA family transporter [Bryobacteraceae bacterium]
MNLLFYCALDRIPLGLAVTVEFTGPLMVALLGSKRFLDVLWAALAMAGILLIAPWSSPDHVSGAGLLFALAAGMMWAAYILLGRRLSRTFEASDGVAVGMLAAALAVLPMIAFAPLKVRFEPRVLIAGIAVAALSSALPYTLEMIALRVLPPRTFGILMSLDPAVAALSGWIVLGEKLHPAQCIAIALVIAASAGTTVTVRQVESTLEV